MTELWIDISEVLAEGREFSFTDQEIWSKPWADFHLNVTALEPMGSTLTVYNQKDSCLVTGSITGKVGTPCARCNATAEISIDQSFEAFEKLDPEEDEADGPSLLRVRYKNLELNVGAILWEQFLLAMPDRALCKTDCKGLCPECGADLNSGTCDCRAETTDPRMAVLRGLKIADKGDK